MTSESENLPLPLLLRLTQRGQSSEVAQKIIAWSQITLDNVLKATRLKNNVLSASVLHIKKSTNKVIKYSESKNKNVNNSITYFCVILLSDDKFVPFWCVLKHDDASRMKFTF